MSGVQSYPLQWPQGFPRAKWREAGQFKVNFETAHANVVRSLRMFGENSGKKISDAILSSNMDMLNRHPSDPGVAVWFTWDGMQVAIAVDRYDTPAKNLQAIHHIIEARRTELRHGTLALVRATFHGFKALPAPKGSHWRDVLGLPATTPVNGETIRRAYQERAKRLHPDQGGSGEAMAALNAARDTALAEIG